MPSNAHEGGLRWFLLKTAALIAILVPLLAAAFFVRKFQRFDRYYHEYRLDRMVHEYLDVPVTVWTSVAVLYVTGTPVSIKRYVWPGERTPNLDWIYNDEKSLCIGPSCTARKHVFLAIAFALAFTLLSWRRRILLAAISTAFIIIFSAIRINVLFHLLPSARDDFVAQHVSSAYFQAIHGIDGYLIAVAALGVWLIVAIRLMPPLPKPEAAGDETLLDDTPKTVTEKAPVIKQ